MKILKSLGILLLVLIAIGTILMLVLPVKQKIERSITINAKPEVVYDYLSRLSNFNKWSAWSRQDTSMTNSISGTDGTLGAVNTWKGDPGKAGIGKIEITSLEIDQEIEHLVTFITPEGGAGKSEFDLLPVNGQTKLTWSYEVESPRPENVLYLFNSLESKLGKDFDASLVNIKTAIEKSRQVTNAAGYEVLPMNFPATRFAARRQMIKWSEMLAFLEQHLPVLYEECNKNKSIAGSPSCLFYVWDEKNQTADMAAAIPVAPGTSFTDTSIQVIDLPATKAVYVNYYGAYDKSAPAYASIDKWFADNNLKQKAPAIEQYITDPKLEKDTSKWLTKIIFLVD